MEDNKDKLESDFMYKSCTTTSDRDAFRICPSKLTKRELEDLYLSLLQEKMEQKKTIDKQQDRIKMLTTKVQRMFSAHKVYQADERKECCVITKCMVDQHKQSVLELKRTNEQMAERIRQLNAQLTSARQISKNRLFCVSKCPRMSPGASPCLTDEMSNRSVETQADLASISQVCDENKFRILMDVLKQKIVNLEEELARAHLEYSNRMTRLEIEVSQCRNQDMLVRQESVLIEPGLQQPVASVRADNELAELKNQLVIEKNKVAMLESQLKTAGISNLVPKTNENQLPSNQEQHSEENKEWESFLRDCTCTPICPYSKEEHPEENKELESFLKDCTCTPVCPHFKEQHPEENKELESFLLDCTCTPVCPHSKEQHPEENKVLESFLLDCTCPPVCPHSKPMCTMLRLFNRRLFSSAKNTNSEEIEVPNRMNDSTPRDVNMRQDLPVDNKHTDEPLVSKYKVLPEVEHKDLSGYSKREFLPKDNEYKNKPDVEYNLPSDSRHTNSFISEEYKKKLNTESKETAGDNNHLDEFQSNKDKNNPSVKKKNLPNKNNNKKPRSGNEYKTLPNSNVQNNEDMAKAKREEKPDVNRPKIPEIKDDRSQSQPYTKTGPDLINYNKSLNLDKDQNITEDHIKNDLALQANTRALNGPRRSTDGKSRLIDSTSKLTDNVSRLTNDKSQRIDIKSRRTDDKKQPIDDKSQGQRTDDTSQRTDEISKHIDDKMQQTDNKKQPIDKESQGQRTDDTSQRTDDKSDILKTSQTWLDSGDRELYNFFAKPEIADTNKQRVQTNNSVTADMPVTNSSQPQSKRNYYINHKCECSNAIKVRDTFNSNANKNFVETMTTDDRNTLNLPNNNISQGLTDTNETLDVPIYNNRPDLTRTNEVQNQTKPYIKKDSDRTQSGANIIPYLIDTNESRGQIEADMTHNTPTYQSSSNIKKNRAQTKIGTTSPNLTDTKSEQGPTETDTIRNIRNHSKNNNSNIKKIKAQSQPDINKSPNLTDTYQTQAQTDMIRNNKNLDLPSANGVQQRIDEPDKNKSLDKLDTNMSQNLEPDKNKSLDKLDTNMSQNLPKPNTNNKKQNNNNTGDQSYCDKACNRNISNASRLLDQTVINMKKDNTQVESDISQELLSKADKILVKARLDQEGIDSNMKNDIDTQQKDNKRIGGGVAYSKDPSTLAENLTDICEEQLETIAELERQLDATKEPPRYSDKIKPNLGKYFNTDEDDINEMPFRKESRSPKNELTTTKVADKNKTGDDLTSKLPQDNTRKSKQIQESSTKLSTNGTKTVTPKNDRDNSLQIPGPITSTPDQTNNWKTKVLRRLSKEGKKRSSKENNKKTKEASSNTGNEVDKEKKLSSTSTENEGTNFYVPERDAVIKASPTTKKETNFVSKQTGSRHDGLSSPVKAMASNNSNLDLGALKVKCMEISFTQTIEPVEKDVQVELKTELIATPDTNGDVPVPIIRALKTYRSKDGTLCFETKPVLDRSCCCQCDKPHDCEDYNIKGTQPEDKNQLTSSLKQGTSTVAHSEGTQCMPLQQVGYLIPVSKNMPAETPKTSPGSPTSPPKIQDTSTETASTSTNVPVTKTTNALEVLPASEIPAASSENKPTDTKTVSTSTSVPANITVVKEVQALPTDAVPKSNNNYIPKEGICTTTTTTEAQSMQLMQERLAALAAELARYKEMLRGPQAPSVTKDQDVCHIKKDTISVLSELDEEGQLMLKRGVALHTIGDKYAPRCVFTLHVGTVVLSDEAVRSIHDKSPVLMWKFYNHNASITRMNAGRVMLFDFASDYDIQITDKFLEYMKYEEMIISICDVENQSEPFATCALPLRDALLHINRRADMSLELVAGPLMIHARSVHHAEDDLDTGDEVGVIDLWCMLRADAKMLPIINKAIARPSKSSIKNKLLALQVKPPLIDSDIGSGSVVTETDTIHSVKKSEQSFQTMRDLHNKNLHRWGSSILKLPSRVYNAASYDKNESQEREEFYKNEMRTNVPKARDSSVSVKPYVKRKSSSKTQPEKKPERHHSKTSVDFASQVSYSSLTPQYDVNQYQRRLTDDEELAMDQGKGAILINEVVANIKTPDDMKSAMERNYRNSLHHLASLPANEGDIVSHNGRSSFRKKSDKTGNKTEANASFNRIHDGNQDFQSTLVLPRLPSDSTSIYKKYDNIAKLYSSKLDIKKQVTINANKRNDDNMQDKPDDNNSKEEEQLVDITILWLALNEECEAMCDPRVQRVYVAYSFLGRSGADLETPLSLPKPRHQVDKCYFNFKKTFQVEEEDIELLGHMARCRAASRVATDFKDYIMFSVISEPPNDPLGLDTCEDIGYAFLYLGDLLAYSAGSSGYTEVIPVRSRNGSPICGVLAVRFDGLDVVRRCAKLTTNEHLPSID